MNLLTPFHPVLGSKRFQGLLNQVRRAAGVGNYWYWLQVPSLANGIRISELVCPLRYDVYARREFFSFYRRNRALYQINPVKFVSDVKATSYYVWYMSSEAVRCNRHLRGNPDALDEGFVERIHRAIDLYERMNREGFSRRYPLTLKTAERLLPPTTERDGPPTGKRVSAKFFLADGWHRLAFLIETGMEVLPAAFFRVKCFREFSPFDSTSLLVHALRLGEASYFRFLSIRYCAPFTFTERDAFLDYVRVHSPAVLNEVMSVLEVDGFGNASRSIRTESMGSS